VNSQPYLGIAWALLGVLVFRFRAVQRELVNTTSALVVSIFLSEIVIYHINETAGLAFWIASGVALVTVYAFRFRRKTDKQAIEYIKGLAIMLIALYPLNFYWWSFFTNDQYLVLSLISVIVPAAGFVYTYHRFILKPIEMKRKFVVILVVQTIGILMFLVFALYQQTLAQNALMQAEAQARLADKNALEVQEVRTELSELQKKLTDCD